MPRCLIILFEITSGATKPGLADDTARYVFITSPRANIL